jgi:hypothetical protein
MSFSRNPETIEGEHERALRVQLRMIASLPPHVTASPYAPTCAPVQADEAEEEQLELLARLRRRAEFNVRAWLGRVHLPIQESQLVN